MDISPNQIPRALRRPQFVCEVPAVLQAEHGARVDLNLAQDGVLALLGVEVSMSYRDVVVASGAIWFVIDP